MFKNIVNFSFVILFYCVLEAALYYKDYKTILLIKEFVEYDIKYKNMDSCVNCDYKIEVEGNKYTITYYRDSLLDFEQNKIIKYNGIVD